jgi:acetylornithine/N-succinyldiaminopimelate aminotransferase
MSQTQEILDRAKQVLIANYARQPIVMTRGEGAYVWDVEGKRYLDLFAGFGGSILGHAHPALVAAATDQAKKLWAVGNTFHNEPQVQFAERLNRFGFRGQAFFSHGGADANEAACKLARLRGQEKKRWKIISLNKSFHGRTLAMIAATGNPKVREGFAPEVPGFIRIEAGDFDLLKKSVDDETAGILIEPIQGEGGINLHTNEYITQIRHLCDERGLTLIFDEVWTGCGRTGKWFAHQYFTDAGKVVEPDIMTLGKAVGGGLPVGVMFAKPEIAALMTPGKHGSTLGGNLICMNVARTIFDVIQHENLLQNAETLGQVAIERLLNEPRINSRIADVRGKGLMIGIELNSPPEKIVEKGLQRGIIINLTAEKVIRLAPPINITREQWETGLNLLVETLSA